MTIDKPVQRVSSPTLTFGSVFFNVGSIRNKVRYLISDLRAVFAAIGFDQCGETCCLKVSK